MQRPPWTLHRQPSEWDQIDFCHSQYLYWGSSKDVRYKSVDRVARVGMNLTLLKGKRIWRMQGIHGRILVLAFSEKALTYFEEFSLRSEAVARVGMTRTLPNGRLSLCLSLAIPSLSLSLALSVSLWTFLLRWVLGDIDSPPAERPSGRFFRQARNLLQ